MVHRKFLKAVDRLQNTFVNSEVSLRAHVLKAKLGSILGLCIFIYALEEMKESLAIKVCMGLMKRVY